MSRAKSNLVNLLVHFLVIKIVSQPSLAPKNVFHWARSVPLETQPSSWSRMRNEPSTHDTVAPSLPKMVRTWNDHKRKSDRKTNKTISHSVEPSCGNVFVFVTPCCAFVSFYFCTHRTGPNQHTRTNGMANKQMDSYCLFRLMVEPLPKCEIRMKLVRRRRRRLRLWCR